MSNLFPVTNSKGTKQKCVMVPLLIDFVFSAVIYDAVKDFTKKRADQIQKGRRSINIQSPAPFKKRSPRFLQCCCVGSLMTHSQKDLQSAVVQRNIY